MTITDTTIAALGYKGLFAREPEAELVVLPEGIKKSNDASGATLTFKVELLVLDGTDATADHIYFDSPFECDDAEPAEKLDQALDVPLSRGEIGDEVDSNKEEFQNSERR